MKLQEYLMIIGLLFATSWISAQESQDTIRYEGIVSVMLYESIELYSDNSFKWTSEYDLSWSEYGIYKIKQDTLILQYYGFDNIDIDTSESINESPSKTEYFLIGDNQIYRLNKRGRKIKRRRDKSFKYKMSCLFGHKYCILKR